jgi:ectoine hydroxylase-related dioxygenase (phytanoyl-CoA dioxygenase family)
VTAQERQREDLGGLRKTYDRDGYVIVRGAIDSGLAIEAQEHVRWLLGKNPGVRPEQLHADLARNDPFWIRLISDPRLLDIAEQFVGPNVALFATHYICKPPRDGQAVLWHQDGIYWPLDPMEVVTLWLAVSDSIPENGCMRVIPGTQTMDLTAVEERGDVANVLGSGLESKYVDETKAVDVVLRAGDVSIHHPNLIHGSEPNRSEMWRMGLTIRYIPASTRILKPETAAPFLLRGEPVPGINVYLPLPAYVPGTHMAFRGCEAWTRGKG